MSYKYNESPTAVAGLKDRIQAMGRFLSGMVIPNIGAFMAWGFITALFIGPGWLPNATLASGLVGTMLKKLLPVLIGYTGGRAVGGQRGAVVGAVATFGVIMGAGASDPTLPVNLPTDAGTPMFLGAMIVGPLGGYLVKKFNQLVEGKIPAGFEMLVNNFGDGLLGLVLACTGLVAIGPVVSAMSIALGNGVAAIVNAGLIPLASIIIEPAKILFLNNAINQGVFTPLGAQQAAEVGKSIFFMLESNPGPGLGVLLAYMIFSKGMAKQSAPGAILIHFFGGIHEIYFPYILMNPVMLLAVIAGGMTGVATFSMLGAGLVGPPSPGSIMMYVIMAPKGGLLPVLLGVLLSCAVSFLVGAVLIKRSKEFSGKELSDAKAAVQEMKAESKGMKKVNVRKIVVACDAGMGSSAMGASVLRNKLKKAGFDITVLNTSLDDIPNDTDIVITHSSLTSRAKAAAPNAEHISIENFVETPVYDELLARFKTK